MKHALLFANGNVTSKEIRRISGVEFDLIIAADGGAIHARRHGYPPQVVIGDLDSITPDIRAQLPKTRFVYRPSQELNDLNKALRYCRKIGVTHLTLLGLCGKRLDHTLNNFSVLARFDRIFHLTIYDEYSQIFLVRNTWEYAGEIGQTVSLIPLGRVAGVRTGGLKWTLTDEELNFGQREGCSNQIAAQPVTIRIRAGLLLVFVVMS